MPTIFDDRPYSCRLHPNERDYLNRSDFLTFADYVHYSIKKNIESEIKNTKQETIRANQKNLIMIGFGVFFVFYSFSVTNLFAWIISFLLGVFFVVTGLTEILMEIKKKIKREGQIGRSRS